MQVCQWETSCWPVSAWKLGFTDIMTRARWLAVASPWLLWNGGKHIGFGGWSILHLLGTYKLNYTEWTEDIGSATKGMGELEQITLVFLSVTWEWEFLSSLTHGSVLKFKLNNAYESTLCCQAPCKCKVRFLQKFYISSKGETEYFCIIFKYF